MSSSIFLRNAESARARQRLVFSYCPSRGTRTKIAALHDLLAQARVKTIAKG